MTRNQIFQFHRHICRQQTHDLLKRNLHFAAAARQNKPIGSFLIKQTALRINSIFSKMPAGHYRLGCSVRRRRCLRFLPIIRQFRVLVCLTVPRSFVPVFCFAFLRLSLIILRSDFSRSGHVIPRFSLSKSGRIIPRFSLSGFGRIIPRSGSSRPSHIVILLLRRRDRQRRRHSRTACDNNTKTKCSRQHLTTSLFLQAFQSVHLHVPPAKNMRGAQSLSHPKHPRTFLNKQRMPCFTRHPHVSKKPKNPDISVQIFWLIIIH